jgi:hypothetical protein
MVKNNWIFDRQIKEMVGTSDPTYTGEDTKVAMINRVVTSTLENLLGRSLSKNEYVEKFTTKINGKTFYDIYGSGSDGYGTAFKEQKYYLKNYPVDTDATFTVELAVNQQVEGTTVLTEDEYVLDAEKGELVITKPINGIYYKAITVTYTAGYDSSVDTESGVVYDADADPAQELALYNEIPADLAQAALFQASHLYDKQQLSNINVRESRSQGSTNSSRFVNIHAISPEAMAIIVQYKRYKFRSV